MGPFRRWLFKLFFGFDPEIIGQIARRQVEMQDDYMDVLKAVVDISETTGKLANETGGPGWTAVVQNAILHLDEKLEEMNSILANHHELITEFAAEDEDELHLTNFQPKKKKDLN